MYGLLALLGIGVMKGIGSIVDTCRDAETKQRTQNEDWYMKASKGGIYSTKTNHPCSQEPVWVYCDGKYKYPQDKLDGAEKGDWVLRDDKTKRIIRNYSKEKRDEHRKILIEEHKKKARAKGRTVYEITKPVLFNSTRDYYPLEEPVHTKLAGDQYKDLNNGRVYVERFINGSGYYMDIETKKLVRMSDSSARVEYLHNIKMLEKELEELNFMVANGYQEPNYYSKIKWLKKKIEENKTLANPWYREEIDIDEFNEEFSKYVNKLKPGSVLYKFLYEENSFEGGGKLNYYIPGKLELAKK